VTALISKLAPQYRIYHTVVVKKMYFHIPYSPLKHSGSNIDHQMVTLKHFTYSPHGVCMYRTVISSNKHFFHKQY